MNALDDLQRDSLRSIAAGKAWEAYRQTVSASHKLNSAGDWRLVKVLDDMAAGLLEIAVGLDGRTEPDDLDVWDVCSYE